MNQQVQNKQRIGYLDALRGFTMLLVVYHHLHYFGYGPLLQEEGSITFNDVVKVFFMPLFFFISGFSSYKNIVYYRVNDLMSFLREKSRVLLFPTIFFFLLYVFLFNYPLTIAAYDKMKVGYWFTITLFEYFVFSAGTSFILEHLSISKRQKDFLFLFLCVLISALSGLQMLGINSGLIGLLSIGQWCYYVFFVAGILGRKHLDKLQLLLDNSTSMSILIVLFFSAIYFYYQGREMHRMQYLLSYLILGGTGVFVLFAFFRKYADMFSEKLFLGRSLQLIGRRTLEIYLLHYFFLPRNLAYIGNYFAHNESPVLEFFISLLIACCIVSVCLMLGSVIGVSDKLGYYLLGKSQAKGCDGRISVTVKSEVSKFITNPNGSEIESK